MEAVYRPIPFWIFIHRCLALLVFILIFQFVHLNLVADATLAHNIVWMIVGALSVSFLVLIISTTGETTQWPKIDPVLFGILYVVSFFAVMIFSRFDYIYSFLRNGLYETRANENIGGGGIYSAITIMFYPLSIILVFVEIRNYQRYIFLAMLAIVMATDFVFLGTRNAPLFVFLFHLLGIRRRLVSFRSIAIILVASAIFVFLFDWQTRARSLDTVTVGWDWRNTLKYSWLMDHLKISDATLDAIGDNAPFLFPVIFLGQYLTHSIGVLADLISTEAFGLLGAAPYLQDQWCVVFKCDRAAALQEIMAVNPFAGLYETLYASVLFDFGWLGGIVIALCLILSYYGGKKDGVDEVSPAGIYLPMVFAVSSIENYLYNGLGMWRFLAFLLLVHGLANTRIRIRGLSSWLACCGIERKGRGAIGMENE